MTRDEIRQIAKEVVRLMRENGLIIKNIEADEEDEYLTTKEAAKLLKVKPSFFYKRPEIPSVGYRKNKRYSKSYLTSLIRGDEQLR